jgi:hypothetical protein
MINKLIALLFLMISFHLNAQVSVKELKKHQKNIEESKQKSKGISSLDTFFCNGEPKALVKVFQKSILLGIEEQSINSFKTDLPYIIITKKYYDESPNERVYYDQYFFPGLNLICDIKNAIGIPNVYENICKYGLINQLGIDTVKAEMFVVLKGRVSIPKQINNQTTTSSYDVIVPRNKSSFLLFLGDNIQQDSKYIGTITKNTVNGKNGLLNQYLIFNSVGVMICTATESSFMSNEWNLLVYKQNKFYKVTSSLGKDKEDILKLLIDNGYL